MAEPTLEYIAKLIEVLSGEIAATRHDLNILTAAVMRLDNTVMRLDRVIADMKRDQP